MRRRDSPDDANTHPVTGTGKSSLFRTAFFAAFQVSRGSTVLPTRTNPGNIIIAVLGHGSIAFTVRGETAAPPKRLILITAGFFEHMKHRDLNRRGVIRKIFLRQPVCARGIPDDKSIAAFNGSLYQRSIVRLKFV